MKRLFTQKQLNNSKSKDLLPYECENCHKTYFLLKSNIYSSEKRNSSCCSIKCGCAIRDNGRFIIKLCNKCGKPVKRSNSEMSKQNRKTSNVFCNHSCQMKYETLIKELPRCRSKIELWIENKLKELYPNLIIIYNDKNAIKLELDIYIPSLKLAFELNGLYHYKPIFRIKRFKSRKFYDKIKRLKCYKNNIKLFTINTSEQKNFKEGDKFSIKYLNFIINKINLFYYMITLSDNNLQSINGDK